MVTCLLPGRQENYKICVWITECRMKAYKSSEAVLRVASSPGGRNDHLVHTVMRMCINFLGMSENSILLPPSAKWRHF